MDCDMESSSWMYADAWRSRVQGLMTLELWGETHILRVQSPTTPPLPSRIWRGV